MLFSADSGRERKIENMLNLDAHAVPVGEVLRLIAADAAQGLTPNEAARRLAHLIIMGLMGYRKRTGFLAGLTVAQISEFSLILGALGLRLGHISPEIMGLLPWWG